MRSGRTSETEGSVRCFSARTTSLETRDAPHSPTSTPPMMDSLSGITAFITVAETRSFTEAGRLLEISSSAVGKSVARMEERLGVRLFHRSTRSVTLTTEGELFLDRCKRIVSEVEAAELELL